MKIDLTVGWRIRIGMYLQVALMVGMGMTGVMALKSASSVFDQYRETAEEEVMAGNIEAAIAYERIATVRFAAVPSSEALEERKNANAHTDEVLEQALKEIREPGQLEKVKTLQKAMEQYDEASGPLPELLKTELSAEQKAELTKKVMDEIGAIGKQMASIVKAMGEESARRLESSGDTLAASNEEAITKTWIWLAGSLVFALVVSWFIGNSITKPVGRIISSLRGAASGIIAASGEVARGGQALAQGSSEQAASLEETAATIEEISSGSKANADNAQVANKVVQSVKEASEESQGSMAQMSKAINAIKVATQETENIVKTIDEIAFQTNLLALNAAVEAARAGDAGKGFAVVAEEVRTLAQRSGTAAKDTAEKIKRSRDLADSGVAAAQGVEKALATIAESAKKAADIVNEIAAASNEQSSGVNQLNGAVTELDKVVQSNAAHAEEFAASGEELASQSNMLGETVAQLDHLVHGARSTEGRVLAAPPKAAPAKAAQRIEEKKSPERRTRPVVKQPAPQKKAEAAPPAKNGTPAAQPKPPAPKAKGQVVDLKPSQIIPLDDADFQGF